MSWYELMVFRPDGILLFATSPKNLGSEEQGRAVYRQLVEKFPASLGWRVLAARWDKAATELDWTREGVTEESFHG